MSRDRDRSNSRSEKRSQSQGGLRLAVFSGEFSVCRMHPKARIPRWIHESTLYTATRTPEELALIAETEHVPTGVKSEDGWSAIRVAGTLDPKLLGVQAALTVPLAAAEIPALTVSTFDTDYLFVRSKQLEDAVATLVAAGHVFDDAGEVDVESLEIEEPDEDDEDFEDDDFDDEDDEDDDFEDEDEDFDDDEDDEDEDFDDDEDDEDEDFDDDEDDEDEDFEDDEPLADVDPDEFPADEREAIDDDDLEGDESDGLYTGAIPQDPVEVTEDTFESLGLSERMIATLEDIGFTHPTPIQAAVIPLALEGSDIIGLAETGSGKTGAFGLPLAERLHHGGGLRGLVLSPTREIALQTKAFLDTFGKDHDLEVAVIIGGVKFGPQLAALRRKPDIIVATPGRLADHMRRGNVRLHGLEELVLDEADHMLDLGFLPQIQEILEQVPDDRRTMMFSATMPKAIERLAQRFLNDPYMADLRPVNRVAAGIEHRLYLVSAGDEKKCLIQLLQQEEGSTLVFARRKLDTEWLARQLEIAGLPVDRIHSDRTQAQRVRALRGFREGKTRILVATDVAARGIDVPRLSHVINFELPDNVEDYVHRAGRTARGKAVGVVSSIGTWQDKVMIKDIERALNEKIPRHEVEGVEPYKELAPRKRLRRRLL